MNNDLNISIFDNIETLAAAVGKYFIDTAEDAISHRGMFTVAVSGGSLVQILDRGLKGRLDGSKWHIFWADERCVPLTDDQSNYAAAQKFFLKHINIPAEKIHTINDRLCPADAAQDYQAGLLRLFGKLPRFDLILLGIGEDGHTASLFPGHSLLSEKEKWVAAVPDSPKPPRQRITLTLPVINNARHVAFIAAGKDKTAVISKISGGHIPEQPLPAQLVRPLDGTLKWFVGI